MQNAPTSPEIPTPIVEEWYCALMDEPESTVNAQGCALLNKKGGYT